MAAEKLPVEGFVSEKQLLPSSHAWVVSIQILVKFKIFKLSLNIFLSITRLKFPFYL